MELVHPGQVSGLDVLELDPGNLQLSVQPFDEVGLPVVIVHCRHGVSLPETRPACPILTMREASGMW